MDFEKLFRKHGTDEHPYPKQIQYKGKTIFFSDKFPVKNLETLVFSIESTNSPHPQGFCIYVMKGFIKVDGYAYSGRRAETNNIIYAHECDNPKHIEVKIYTKENHVLISNVWQETVYKERVHGLGTGKFVDVPEGKKVTKSAHSSTWGNGCEEGHGVCMYSEDIPNGKRYFCNDGELDDDFDDIVFTVTRKL